MSDCDEGWIQKPNESPRELEIRAIRHVTRGLARTLHPGSTPLDRVKALYWNNRMWSIFIEDLSGPDNLLPFDLRGSYVSLGLFVQRASAAAMAGNRDLSILIAINDDLLEALEGQGAGQPPGAFPLPHPSMAGA